MIKGVNKNIIEIANTGSEYFDRAILFVNSEHSKAGSSNLKKQADIYLSAVEFNGQKRKPGRREIEQMKKTKKVIKAACGLLMVTALIITTYLIAQML